MFGNYTNSDIDFDPDPILRESGAHGVGDDATLKSGSAGGYALLTNGILYGLAIASGEFGDAEVKSGFYKEKTDFDTSGFASSLFGGIVISTGPRSKLDLRGGLNYLTATARLCKISAGECS